MAVLRDGWPLPSCGRLAVELPSNRSCSHLITYLLIHHGCALETPPTVSMPDERRRATFDRGSDMNVLPATAAVVQRRSVRRPADARHLGRRRGWPTGACAHGETVYGWSTVEFASRIDRRASLSRRRFTEFMMRQRRSVRMNTRAVTATCFLFIYLFIYFSLSLSLSLFSLLPVSVNFGQLSNEKIYQNFAH